MDWSAIYEETGEEEGKWESYGETRSSRVAHRILHTRKLSMPLSRSRSSFGELDFEEISTQKYSPIVAYAFTVNYILGVGSLGIPYAFYRVGLVMGNALIILVTILSYWTVMWVSETIARARASPLIRSINEKTALKASEFEDFPEVTQLCTRFLGPVGSRMYQLSLLGLMYGGLLGYSQVFVNSFLTQVTSIGGIEVTSVHGALVFAMIVIPLSCADLTEQIIVQLVMSVVRFVALLIMILSAAYAIFADPYDSGSIVPPDTNQSMYISSFRLIDLSGFGVMFSTGVFSQLFQHSVPGLLAPLGTENQSKAHSIFGATLLTTMFFYISLGSIGSLYFGPKVASSVNLNWAEFTWGLAPTSSLLPLWAKMLSTLVVVFPAVDTLSVYPLISVTLGDNIATIIPDQWIHAVGGRGCLKLICRMLASVPPLLIAVFVSDLSMTMQFSGLAGIYVAFFAPALLYLSSSKEFPSPNVYSGWCSDRRLAYSVLVFGAFAFVVLMYQFTQQIVQDAR